MADAGQKSDTTEAMLREILTSHGLTARQAQEAAALMTKNEGRGTRFIEILGPPNGGQRTTTGAGPLRPAPAAQGSIKTGTSPGDDQAVEALLDGLSRVSFGDSDFRKKKAFVREMVTVRLKALKKVLTGHIGHVSLFIQAGNEIPSLVALMQDLHALRAQVEASELMLLTRFNPVEPGPSRERGPAPDEEYERV